MIYIGIDPGKLGAMAIIGAKGDDEEAHVIPFDKSAYLEAFDELQGAITKCCLERVIVRSVGVIQRSEYILVSPEYLRSHGHFQNIFYSC